MENPNLKGGATPQDLRMYAHHRKDGELQDIKQVLKDLKKGKFESVEDSDEYRQPLSVEVQKVVKVQLSWGGDGDGFKFYFDRDGELLRGLFYWEDWGCYEEIPLDDEDAEMVADYYGINCETK